METTNMISSSELVNREDELRNIEEALYRLTTPDKKIPKQILEFNGIGGIGKTALLERFLQQCKTIKNLRYSFIDFSKFLKDGKIDLNILNIIVVTIVKQINIKNDLFNQIVGAKIDNSRKTDLTPELIKYLRRILKSPQDHAPIVLIFDSVDVVDQNVKDWLSSILELTVDAGKILFAVASKISLGLSKRPNLEKKVYSFRLKELNQEFTLRQIQGFSHFDKIEDLETFAHVVFRMTHGHPLANLIVVSEARKDEYNPQTISNKSYEFVRIIDQQVVREKVFYGYDAKEIDRFREMLTLLSIPRMFNLNSMGKLISQFAPDHALKSSWHYSNYIRELKAETSFIRYSQEKSAYVVDPILRNVFSLMLKNEKLKNFRTIHGFLVDMYTEWIAEAKGTDKTKFFIEKIYHQLSLEEPINSLLVQFKEFSKIVGRYMPEEQRRDAKQQFIEEFKLDQDLSEFFNESAKHKIREMFD